VSALRGRENDARDYTCVWTCTPGPDVGRGPHGRFELLLAVGVYGCCSPCLMLPAKEGRVPLPADAGRGRLPPPPQAPTAPPVLLLLVADDPCLLPHALLVTGGKDPGAAVPQAPMLVGGDLPADPQLTLPLYRWPITCK
jgi:hypothetical protein